MGMVRYTGRLDRRKCNSASTAALCVGTAEECAHFCKRLATAKGNSQTQIYKKTGFSRSMIEYSYKHLEYSILRKSELLRWLLFVALPLYLRILEELE